jgi:glycosyltransferase involved in cell wall biosynthesis
MTDVLHVAFVSVSDRMGGSEVVLLEIVRGLRRARPSWALHLAAPGDGPLSQAARAAGATTVTLAMPPALATFGETAAFDRGAPTLPVRLLRAAASVPGYQRAMNGLLDRLSPDVVHTNGFKAHVFAARGGAAGAALIWHVHEYVMRRPMTRRLLRRYAGRCDAIVANSDSVAADVRAAVGGRAVQVIPNAVDLDVFSPHGCQTDLDALCGLPPAPAGTVRVGLVATFARWKGHAVFLEALAAIPRDLPLRGYIVGGPVYDTRGSQRSMAELAARARTLGVDGRVGLTDFVEAPAGALRALDIVVHASTDPEPFGMVIAEAMACGRAVVTSGTGGAAELVRDGLDAMVHQAGNAADLASCIARLARDRTLRERLGGQARATAVARFDSRRLADRFASLYEEAAGRRRRPR